MHRCYSQIKIDEPNILKYESEKHFKVKIIKPSTSALLINRTTSFCQSSLKHPDLEFRQQQFPNGKKLSCVLSDDTFVENRLRRTNSCFLHGSHSFLHVYSDSLVQRTTSEVKLCRKRATTRINMSQIPPAEISSADSFGAGPSKESSKVELEEKNNEDEVDSDSNDTIDTCQVESLPYIKNEPLKLSMSVVNKLQQQKEVCASMAASSASKDKKTLNEVNQILKSYTQQSLPQTYTQQSLAQSYTQQSLAQSYTQQSLTPSQDEGPKLVHPQLDKIFSQSERFGPCCSNSATDFSRALLHSLLQRGKDASLEFETSQAGTFSFSEDDENDEMALGSPIHASVEELATKIVQRINQVKEGKGSTFKLHTIKTVFDKLIAASPNLSNQFRKLKDLYSVNSQTNENLQNENSSHPLPDNVNKLERLEEELHVQAALLSKLVAELENIKEQQNVLTEKLNDEGENLAELAHLTKSWFSSNSRAEGDNLDAE